MNSRYVQWLQRQGEPLFKAGNMYWRVYQGALVPAPATTCYAELKENEAYRLLKESGAMFLRYANNPCEHETEWWYILCDNYHSDRLAAKTRQNIRRGNRDCSVKKISTEWLADHGYPCYLSAFGRYLNAIPSNENAFRTTILSTIEGPFEYWGVFNGDHLAGYCQCIVEHNDVVTNITKYDPAFLRNRTAYALISNLINHYIVERGMTLSNGNRSIAHDTNYQDVLVSMGFRKQYCKLNVVYKKWLQYTVNAIYPVRKLIRYLPDNSNMHKLKSLLYQEELRKSFIST